MELKEWPLEAQKLGRNCPKLGISLGLEAFSSRFVDYMSNFNRKICKRRQFNLEDLKTSFNGGMEGSQLGAPNWKVV